MVLQTGRRKWCAYAALVLAPLMAGPAQAEVLPWLEHKVADPFATQEKANRMISPSLKPEDCPSGLPSADHKLDFVEVVTLALCHNPTTKAAYLTLLAQASSYGTNYSAYFPTVSANVNNSRSTSFIYDGNALAATTVNGVTVLTNTPTANIISSVDKSYGLSASWTLYDFGQREFRLEAAEQTLIAAGYSYDSTLQGTIASALNAYFQLLTAQNGVDVARESERYAEESYDAAALRHKIGQVPLADELQARGTYSQAILASQQAGNLLSQDRAALALLMGMPADSPVQVAELDNRLLEHDPFKGTVQSWMQQAQQKRNDLLASQAQIEGSKISLQALKRSDLATVSITTNVTQNNDTINVFRGGDATRSQAIGLSVSIPIFTGFSQTYNERAAREQLEAQEDTLASTELTVEQDVWNSWHNYETAKKSWETSQDLMTSALQLKDVALGRYKEGIGSILDVLNAESQYSSALQSNLQSRYNLLSARVDLVRAVGVLNLDSMHPDWAANPAAAETAQPER